MFDLKMTEKKSGKKSTFLYCIAIYANKSLSSI